MPIYSYEQVLSVRVSYTEPEAFRNLHNRAILQNRHHEPESEPWVRSFERDSVFGPTTRPSPDKITYPVVCDLEIRGSTAGLSNTEHDHSKFFFVELDLQIRLRLACLFCTHVIHRSAKASSNKNLRFDSQNNVK